MAHGDAVNLNGSQWQACVERGCLVLSEVIRTDDKKERTASRIANIKREVEGRKQELEALAVDFARVADEAETVPSCCLCFVCFVCLVCHVHNMFVRFLLLDVDWRWCLERRPRRAWPGAHSPLVCCAGSPSCLLCGKRT